MSRFRFAADNLFRRDRVERELDDEVRGYAHMLQDENIGRGMNPDEACRMARIEMGGPEQLKEEVRGSRAGAWLESVVQDFRFALRMLRKNPGFAAIAILTLALGIGANTAIFSVIRGVLLQALPFREPSQIVMVRGTVAGQPTGSISYPDYLDFRARNSSMQDVSAYSALDLVLGGADHSERIPSEMTTDSYFSVLGVAPMMGRTFLPEENKTLGSAAVAVVGYGLWQRAFAGDAAIVGKTARLSDATFTIIGVMPRGFTGFSDKAEVWIPIMMHDVVFPQTAQYNLVFGRGNRWMRMVARLRAGISLEQAQAESSSIAIALQRENPEDNKDRGMLLRKAQDVFVGAARKPLLLLLGAVGFVLLIACANVVNLVLAKLASRDREFAVRTAMGAPRSRIVRQLLTECVVLAALGAGAAICVVIAAIRGLVTLFPLTFPSYAVVRVDREVLAFTAVIALLTAGLLVLLPAFAVGRRELHETLKEGTRGSSGTRGRRLHSALVVSEVALAAILLIGAGLLLKSFAQLMSDDTGFRPENLLTMRFEVPSQITGEARNHFGPELADRISQLPEVQSAAVTFIDPFVFGGFGRGFTLEDHERLTSSEQDSITYQEAGPGFFHTMGIPIVRGREFSNQDSPAKPQVVIVNNAFAKRFWPAQNAVGKRLHFGGADANHPWMEIVGVVGDVKFDSLKQDPSDSPVVYAAIEQAESIDGMSIVVRTKVDPAQMISSLRQQITAFNPAIALYSVATLRDRMLENSADARAYAALLGLFAALAAALCAIGIYGVISFWVAQRTREIGIRVALGAGRGQVMRLVAGRGLRLTLIGLALGIAASLALTRTMAGMLYEVRPFDPEIFAAMLAVMSAIALLACWIPTRRAMNVDPIVALRDE